VPVALEYCFTRRASAADTAWIERGLRYLCAPFRADVERSGGLVEVRPSVTSSLLGPSEGCDDPPTRAGAWRLSGGAGG
jgi:hypothetical protein